MKKILLIDGEKKSKEEKIASDYIKYFLIPRIPDLVSIILYGGTLTGIHQNKNEKPDIDLLVVTKGKTISNLEREDLIHIAFHKNIHVFWEQILGTQRGIIVGEFLTKIEIYKVLYGTDYLAEYVFSNNPK